MTQTTQSLGTSEEGLTKVSFRNTAFSSLGFINAAHIMPCSNRLCIV